MKHDERAVGMLVLSDEDTYRDPAIVRRGLVLGRMHLQSAGSSYGRSRRGWNFALQDPGAAGAPNDRRRSKNE